MARYNMIFNAVVNEAEYKSEFKLTKDTPHTLSSRASYGCLLLGFSENWPHCNAIAMYNFGCLVFCLAKLWLMPYGTGYYREKDNLSFVIRQLNGSRQMLLSVAILDGCL